MENREIGKSMSLFEWLYVTQTYKSRHTPEKNELAIPVPIKNNNVFNIYTRYQTG